MQVVPILLSFSLGMVTVIVLEILELQELLEPLRGLFASLLGGP